MAEEIERLEEAIGRARQSRFYRDRIVGHPVRSLDDLRRLPFTRRSDLEAAGLDGLLAVPRSRLWQYTNLRDLPAGRSPLGTPSGTATPRSSRSNGCRSLSARGFSS